MKSVPKFAFGSGYLSLLCEEGGAAFVPDAAIRNSSAIKAVTFRPVHVTPAVLAASAIQAAPPFRDVLGIGKPTALKADSPPAVVSNIVGYK